MLANEKWSEAGIAPSMNPDEQYHGWFRPKWEIDTVAESMLAAADYLESHGWRQRGYTDDQGRVCMVGALLKVGEPHLGPCWERLYEYLGMPPYQWNDQVCQSKAEAVAALRAAAYAR